MKTILSVVLAVLVAACGNSEDMMKGKANATKAALYTVYHSCGHRTRKGLPCKRRVPGTRGYCWQHRKS